MTDIITTSPHAARHIRFPRLRLPRLGLGTSLAGQLMFLGDAYGSVYTPFGGHGFPPRIVGEQGRRDKCR